MLQEHKLNRFTIQVKYNLFTYKYFLKIREYLR